MVQSFRHSRIHTRRQSRRRASSESVFVFVFPTGHVRLVSFFISFMARRISFSAVSLRFSAIDKVGPHEKTRSSGEHSCRDSLISFSSSRVIFSISPKCILVQLTIKRCSYNLTQQAPLNHPQWSPAANHVSAKSIHRRHLTIVAMLRILVASHLPTYQSCSSSQAYSLSFRCATGFNQPFLVMIAVDAAVSTDVIHHPISWGVVLEVFVS